MLDFACVIASWGGILGFLNISKADFNFAQIVAYARLLCGRVLHCQLLICRTKMCFSKLTSEGKYVLLFLLS